MPLRGIVRHDAASSKKTGAAAPVFFFPSDAA
jgi:hypothetical protein